jgi:hypothetical protein
MIVVFTRGPLLFEVPAQVPSDAFAQLETAMETTLYSLASALDAQAQRVLGASQSTTESSPTPTATSTPLPSASPTKTPVKTSKKHKKCKKGYKLKHGKCKKVRKP